MPKCCENCDKLNSKGGCEHYNKCRSWLSWFRRQWLAIRVAAALMCSDPQKRQRMLSDIFKEDEDDDQGTTESL